MRRLTFLRTDTLISFLRLVGLILLPFFMALAGLALLTSPWTALIWLVMISAIAYAYVRFNARHNEHEEYDDRPTEAMYNKGLEDYLSLIAMEKNKKKE